MTNKIKLVMATNNKGKLHEARAIAGDKLEILSLDDIGYHQDIPETADTLEGNALIKVRAIKEATGMDCFADDTGLMVDALGGAPGVHTARYAGMDCNPDNNIELMLKNMDGVADRHASFNTCVALSLNGEEHTFHGTVEGTIATERFGSHGFGYDPIFIPDETGVCFAEMTDEAKNAISHRGRAISAMMKWLTTLCLCLLCSVGSHAASSSADWRLFNTFDDLTNNIFDTPDKTYFLVQGQYQEARFPDNADRLCFLFCLDKNTGEVRPYNSQNFLSGSLISLANYNARKNYLFIIYADNTIEILYDNGDSHILMDLKNFSTNVSKGIRSISFDPESDRAYISTDFGYIAINDKKYEVAMSGIYGMPIDKMARLADKLLIIRDGKLYYDNLYGNHISIDDFKELDWNNGSSALDLIPLSESRCIVSKMQNGNENHFVLTWAEGDSKPFAIGSGSYANMGTTENKDGVLFDQMGEIVQINRETGDRTVIKKRAEDYNVKSGSWDLKDFYFSRSREGFQSLRLGDDNTWTVTSEVARPNAPAVFRSDALMYTPQHGMLANTHGLSRNFVSNNAKNPILLSGYKDGEWNMYGLPYLDLSYEYRLKNPCGFAQDPDDPDVFYFGSVLNGLLRYNIKDLSSLLHMTSSTDNPSMEGHVTVQEPYEGWSNSFMVMHPKFDSKGNLIMSHTNTSSPDDKKYFHEIWLWPADKRRASVSPETFQSFTRIPIEELTATKVAYTIPLMAEGARDMVVCFPSSKYESPFMVYDHNGTIEELSDDRKVIMKDLEDNEGKITYNYLQCAIEDPQNGLVWVGTDNGVFTFDPKEAFANPNKASRIKVSRNDGTSLADYLLAGISVNNIAIDGQGRKWFSLSGGGLVCTTADGKNILQEINSENSMLPSDIVYSSCYNPDNNSMMIATSAGLCEYFLTGQSADTASSEIRAYPNPVRHDYFGWVTIDGLEDDCIVKIADSAGNLVRELGPASAGKVQWDVCGMDLNRVPSGVYFVLATSGPGEGSYSEKTKILVINR